MKTDLKTIATATALVFAAAVPPGWAADGSQLIANAGLTTPEAAGISAERNRGLQVQP